MGYGDQLMATGMARGAKARGKRIAFGDGEKIIWDHHSPAIFKDNPNIAAPGSEGDADLEWISFYRGNRVYQRQVGKRFVWNMDFRPRPGELFFSEQEKKFAAQFYQVPFVVIEPNVPSWKVTAANKRWPLNRYAAVDQELRRQGYATVQFDYGEQFYLTGTRKIKTPDFRHAAAVLANAALYIGPEGGLHHAASAVGIDAVVLVGGFIPPAIISYGGFATLTGGARRACGNLTPCQHCQDAMEAIKIEEVLDAAAERLRVPA